MSRKRPAGWLLCKASQFAKSAIQRVSISVEPGFGRPRVLAYAKIFMASAATSLSLAGVVIVGALGETIRTTGRHLGGLDQFDDDCVVAAVIWPWASGIGARR